MGNLLGMLSTSQETFQRCFPPKNKGFPVLKFQPRSWTNLPGRGPAFTVRQPLARAFWMRQAIAALLAESPCPLAAFGSVIVNHTAPGLGELVCTGVNTKSLTGNPTHHGRSSFACCYPRFTPTDFARCTGEIDAINNCTAILIDPHGRHKLSPADAVRAFTELSLYTNAESCPMVRPIVAS